MNATIEQTLQNLPLSVKVNLDILKRITTSNPNKPKVISSVTEKEQEVFKFFSVHAPCWFEGCEDLRKEYQEALDKLPQDCPACQKGQVIKAFVPKITKQLEKHYGTIATSNR